MPLLLPRQSLRRGSISVFAFTSYHPVYQLPPRFYKKKQAAQVLISLCYLVASEILSDQSTCLVSSQKLDHFLLIFFLNSLLWGQLQFGAPASRSSTRFHSPALFWASNWGARSADRTSRNLFLMSRRKPPSTLWADQRDKCMLALYKCEINYFLFLLGRKNQDSQTKGDDKNKSNGAV